MTIQVEESLKTTRLTLNEAKLDWALWCEKLPKLQTTRYTLSQDDGIIICDTLPDKKGKRLKDLKEIHAALKNDFDSEVRFSDIFGTDALFAALKVNDTMVIRKAVPISSLRNDMTRFDRILFMRIVPFAILSFLFFIFLFYRATKPLGIILSKVEKFKDDIPFNRNLQLLYARDEWAQIEEALIKADQKLQKQVIQAKVENEKITAILESINEDIIAIDKYDTILFYNTNFQKNFLRERTESELMPKIWHTFKEAEVLQSFRTVLATGEIVSLPAMSFPESHHPDHFFELTIGPLKGAEGNIIGALGVFYDVTEFKLTEQMRVDFVANVSHEIRTPLTSVKGYTQILQSQKDKIDPSLHLFLEKILNNSERMISLFNDLLSLSVIESQNLVKFEEFYLPTMVETVSSNIITSYAQKKVTIEKDLRLENIKGDVRLIEQVITNLVDNACKYGPEHPVVKISSSKHGTRALITVSDNGPGIPKEHIQRIFERFYRVDSSRETSRGTGLGLSIVKHIIAKHGGRIWASSEENHGTTFSIELPLE